MFDLIIANPPYGKSSSVSRKIVNKLLEMKAAEEMVVLAPLNTFKDYPTFVKYVEKLGNVNEYFEDASCPNLSITYLQSAPSNVYKDWNEILEKVHFTEKEKIMFDAIQRYNENRLSFYKELLQMMYASHKERYAYIPEENIFSITIWAPADGVHLTGEDVDHNINGLPIDWREASSAPWGIYFESIENKKNFTKWWYSCNADYSGKKARKGLCNFLLNMLAMVGNGDPSINKYPKYFPNLDWTKEWTDEEIIAELKEKAGLPKDWEI